MGWNLNRRFNLTAVPHFLLRRGIFSVPDQKIKMAQGRKLRLPRINS